MCLQGIQRAAVQRQQQAEAAEQTAAAAAASVTSDDPLTQLRNKLLQRRGKDSSILAAYHKFRAAARGKGGQARDDNAPLQFDNFVRGVAAMGVSFVFVVR